MKCTVKVEATFCHPAFPMLEFGDNIADRERLVHRLSLVINDTNRMAALGDVDSNNKHSKHHPAEIRRQPSRSYESYPASR